MRHRALEHAFQRFGLHHFALGRGLLRPHGRKIPGKIILKLMTQRGNVGAASFEYDTAELLASHGQQKMFHGKTFVATRTHLHNGQRQRLHQRTCHHQRIPLFSGNIPLLYLRETEIASCGRSGFPEATLFNIRPGEQKRLCKAKRRCNALSERRKRDTARPELRQPREGRIFFPGLFSKAGSCDAVKALTKKRRPQHATAVPSAIPFPWCSAGGIRHAEPSPPPASPGIRLFPSDTPHTRPCPSDARTS